MHRRTPGMASRRASGIFAPHSAHASSDGPVGSLLFARLIASFTVASIWSWTAPSFAQPVAMAHLRALFMAPRPGKYKPHPRIAVAVLLQCRLGQRAHHGVSRGRR